MGQYDKLPIIFLDRDGTIIVDKVYLNDPNEVEFIDGVIEGLKKLYLYGFKLVIVTNQSGISRGLVQLENLNLIHKKMVNVLKSFGIEIYRIYYCPHLPSDNCSCRKPKIGLVEELLDKIDVNNSFVIGDKDTDVLFGKNLGVKTVLIQQNRELQLSCKPDFISADFISAVNWILKNCNLHKNLNGI